VPDDYGFGYVKALVQSYYSIPDVRKIEADGLDIIGADVDAIMAEAEETLSAMQLD
jgi:FMN-dependent NADH-azoreductase